MTGQEEWNWEAVSLALKRQRGVKHINQEQLAKDSQVGIQLVRELERGLVARRNLNNLAAISEVLWGVPEAIELIAQGKDVPRADLAPRVSVLEADLKEVREQVSRIAEHLGLEQ